MVGPIGNVGFVSPREQFARWTLRGRCGGPLGANPGGMRICAKLRELYRPPREAPLILK